MLEILINLLVEYKAVIVVCLLPFACWKYYQAFSPKLRKLDVPSIDGVPSLYGTEFCTSIFEGTRKFPDQVFKLNTSNYETVIIPARFIDELKSAPESAISLGMELYERQLGRYTLIGTVGRDHRFVNAIRQDLNRNLAATLPSLLAEVEYATQASVGPVHAWKPVPIYSTSLRIVALLTGRVFVGLPLSRSEAWVKTSVELTVDTFVAAFALWKIHWTLRPVVAWLMPQIWRIHRRNRHAGALLKPYLEQRLQNMQNQDFKKPVDMLQFFVDNMPNHDPHYQAMLQSAINVAAIHTTSMNVTNTLYDLAARPEYVKPLREELDSVLSKCDGILDKNALVKMRKMDSFLRESQRINPPGVVSMSRKVESDTILSDGTLLPKGCLIACDSWSSTRDPDLWDDPEKFDGFRFEKLRDIPGNESKYQFVTTGPRNMAFGHGAHSCPGRFFVANEIKILMAYIIRNYDIKLKDGEERPKNFYNNIMILPDHNAELLFRSRDPKSV
ncbi:7615435c-f8b0-4d97-b05e-86868eac4630 [Sclerotinia trifoliorum]|uniref:7615435c-f8b0-4d97-b05e-86868eac4630 n=1 Tax=Sclerotinia trifoliorum TaxID=28548 RepID=A0A8H2ZNY9_9HELO|nr:7615435c-f8b0-4d97-b05e-86868eac4630 [Sclerotinia trifoliorum]